VPAANCADVVGDRTTVSLVKVDTLHSAIGALQKIDAGGPDAAGLPRC
jgi:hypothetical protein